jgi:hypothetical protein
LSLDEQELPGAFEMLGLAKRGKSLDAFGRRVCGCPGNKELRQMKVRWTKVSLRLRITPGELEALEAGEPVVERLQFGEGQGWETAIIPSDATTDLACVGGTVQITLSLADCCRLSNPEVEGIYFQRAIEPLIRYFIEKDFPCAHLRAPDAMEPITDTFVPPTDFEARKAIPHAD